MACKSASVQRAQKKSEIALEAIKKLEKNIKDLAQAEESDFKIKILEYQDEISVSDFKMLESSSAVKVDFTHEFNADALIPVITNILKTAATFITGSSAVSILTSAENIKTYADLLGTIAESIKTNSLTGGNTSYSMNRLAPGFFAFTATKSMTISEKETFGEESITATSFYYAFYFSEEHAIKISKWNGIFALIKMIKKLNEARIGLVDGLMSDKFTLAEFNKLSAQYKLTIEVHESELSAIINEKSVVGVVQKAISKSAYTETEVIDSLYDNTISHRLLTKATDVFGSRGSLYTPVLNEAKDLLSIINVGNQ